MHACVIECMRVCVHACVCAKHEGEDMEGTE